MRCIGACLCFATLLSCTQVLQAQSALAARVLVVYAANDPNSSAVAAHYQSKRGVPGTNLCAITLPDINATGLSPQVFIDAVKTPVQSCLNAAGRENILYIVLAYLRPYVVDPGAGLHNYALDSYLEDIWDQYTTQSFDPWPTRSQPYYASNQSQGSVFEPFQSLAAYRARGTLPLIYSVWRLDGATPALAQALVDNAMAAEAAGGPISQIRPTNACIDMTIAPASPDTGYGAANWDLLRASEFLSTTANFNVVVDTNGTVFGTPPSSVCPNTALYAGWYNYGQYIDAFSWLPGSIGWDLNSGALTDPRQGIWWGTNALLRGLSVTSGPTSEPYLEGLARPSGVLLNLLEGANVGDAFLRNTRWLKWHILNIGDPLYVPFAGGLPPFTIPLTTNSLSLNPRELVGGNSPVAVTVTLASPAPSDGVTLNLSSSNPSFSIPAAITVPAGATTASFLGSTGVVTGSTDVIVTASAASFSVANTVTLDPLLNGISFERYYIKGGQSAPATLVLNASAPLSGITVQLSSDRPDILAVPASVSIPGGLGRVNFTISISPVGSNTDVNITASYAGASPVTQVTITP